MLTRRNLIVIGVIVIGLMVIIASSSQIYAQGDDDKEYVGARDCAMCHRDLGRSHDESPHALALTSDRDDEFWIADFDIGEDIRNIAFSDSEERTFGKDDVSFALGMGRYVQRYLYEVDRDEYVVFPAEWNTLTEEWQAYGPVENWPDDPAYDFVNSCAGCHTTGLVARRGRWEDDGVKCEACHGPASLHVEEAEDAGNRPSDRDLHKIRDAIVLSPSAQVCGQCHSQGLNPEDDYPFPTEYVVGSGNLLDEDVFALVDADSDVHWWSTGHAASSNMQFNEWLGSAHATSLPDLKESDYAEESCLACHSSDYRFINELLVRHEDDDRNGDPPEAITLETATLSVTCVTCHNPHAEPDTTEFFLRAEPYALCVDCHSDNDATDGLHHPVQQMFEGLTVVAEVEGVAGTHFTEAEGPECITCHMPRIPMGDLNLASHQLNPIHPDEALNIEGLDDSCSSCHGEAVEALGLQAFIDDTQASTRTRFENAQNTLVGDEAEWVGQSLAFIEGDGSWGVHNYAYADQLLDAIEVELGLAEAVVFDPEAFPTSAVLVDVEIDEAADSEFSDSGPAPIGVALMALSVLVLGGAAYLFFMKSEASDDQNK